MQKKMGEIENLDHRDAVKKMKELVEHTSICLFTTHFSKTPLQTRPMATQEVDDEGNLWFFSDEESNKNFQIAEDSRVQLFYSNPSKSEFMSVYGHAMIIEDRNKIEALWNPMAKAWFKGGKDDPSLSLILVIPDEAYYWDTKNSKMVSMVKILSSVVSGKTMDDGIEGKLKV